MRFFEALILFILFLLLFGSLYFLWSNLPVGEEQSFETYIPEIEEDLPAQSSQFYDNMRYIDKRISYEISPQCSERKRADFESAVQVLEEKTILSFYKKSGAEIIVTCSNIAPRSEEKDHFIAGEGGPSEIINASRFAVILSGKIALYRPESCDEPKIATHEILHALGFEHNNNSNSVMYPVTSCEQEVDQYIIDEINRLYSVPSRADLLIEEVVANKTGRYLNFEVTVANYGFREAKDLNIEVSADGGIVQSFKVESLDIGTKRRLTVTNLRVPRDAAQITFFIDSAEQEISKENNRAILIVKGD